jgi:TonB family protein
MKNRFASLVATLAVALILAASPAPAQTAAELLQKGIYTQETAGDLDGAISLYRQIVNSGSSPRDLAAQAQYRLAQSLIQKGDLGNAASEFEKLARNYADYGKLISNLANVARFSVITPGGRGRGGAAPGDALTPEQELADRAKMLATVQKQLETERAAGRPGVRYWNWADGAAIPPSIKVGGAVANANILSKTTPQYPALAKAARVQGTVTFTATIGKDGRIENLDLVSGPPLLVQAAMESVRQWVYKPTLLNGQPVTVVTTIDVNFTLSN